LDKKNECAIHGDIMDIYEIGLDVENKENRNLRIGKIILCGGFLATIALSFILGALIF